MPGSSAPQPISRLDYQVPEFLIDDVVMRFELGAKRTLVHARYAVKRNPASQVAATDLVLQGENLVLDEVMLNDKLLTQSDYNVDESTLTITAVPDEFTLEVTTTINPKENTTLSGLYWSNGILCTQCEAHGFRRITYFLDRPDNLASFTVRLEADLADYPNLLANGNLIDSGSLAGGRHFAVWQDPFSKPCYLFALVGGKLDKIEDSYTTCSGREVALSIYSDPGKSEQCHIAMEALKKSMRWDEEHYGREYDLDIFMIVAVRDFNFGAMENKGLNIFNDQYILADPKTATDRDIKNVERVVAHEYFHNWSGNRITCRDWFQLSLKEGFTVYREHSFCGDEHSIAVTRIDEAQMMSTVQFAEDAGPMAHPVRPDSYIEINNFYTVTIYEKGGELIRMMNLILGDADYRTGSDLYFARHDGQAVTTDDFVQAMEDASGVDLTQFKLWYSHAGTPELTVSLHFDAATNQVQLTVKQQCPPTPDKQDKGPMDIPLAMSLLDKHGKPQVTELLRVKQAEQVFTFDGFDEAPVPSLLHGFSAPVKIHYPYTEVELAHIMAFEQDPYARWSAKQCVFFNRVQQLLESKETLQLPASVFEAYTPLLQDNFADLALQAQLLEIPSEQYLVQLLEKVDPKRLRQVRELIVSAIAERFEADFRRLYASTLNNKVYAFTISDCADRRLKAVCLDFILALGKAEDQSHAAKALDKADNMSDAIIYLTALSHHDCDQRKQALQSFYKTWHTNPLVLDKWFMVQGASHLPERTPTIGALMHHPDFTLKNPNRARALLGAWSRNLAEFHSESGYSLMTDVILKVDAVNPLLAARFASTLVNWRRFAKPYQDGMLAALNQLLEAKLSNDTYEIVSKAVKSA